MLAIYCRLKPAPIHKDNETKKAAKEGITKVVNKPATATSLKFSKTSGASNAQVPMVDKKMTDAGVIPQPINSPEDGSSGIVAKSSIATLAEDSVQLLVSG